MKRARHINGYTIVHRSNDPTSFRSGKNAGYKYKHRVVAEQTLGRQLSDTEVVHHIDGNKSDNRPENLLVLTTTEHSRLHKYLSNNPDIARLPPEEQLRFARMSKEEDLALSKLEGRRPLAVKVGTCSKCGGVCSKRAKMCKKCILETEYKPITDEFRERVRSETENSSVLSVARRLGVSDNSVRKIITGSSNHIRKDRELLPNDPFDRKSVIVSEKTREAIRQSNLRYWKDRPSPNDIAVVQIDNDGNVIGEFRSARDAQRKTGIPNTAINQCCHGKRKSYCGSVWRFKRDMLED